MLYLITFIIIILTFAAYKKSLHFLVSPVLVITSSFLIALFFCVITTQWDLGLSWRTLLVIVIGIITFGIGQVTLKKVRFLAPNSNSCSYHKNGSFDYIENAKAANYLLIIQIVLVIGYIHFILQIGGGLNLEVIHNTRTWMLYNKVPRIYGQVELFSFSIAAIYVYILVRNILIKRTKKRLVRYVVIIVLYIFIEAISSSRSGVIYFLAYILTIVVYLYQKQLFVFGYSKNKQSKKIVKIVVEIFICILVLFVLLGNFTGKTAQLGVANMISTYFGGSIYNLEYFLNHIDYFKSPSFGYFTLPIVSSMLEKFGIDTGNIDIHYFPMNVIPTKVGSIVTSETNLYTCFVKPIVDYGIFGSILFFLLLGMIYGLFYYHLVRSKDAGLLLIFYGVLIMPLVGASAAYLFGSLVVSPASLYKIIYIYIIYKLCIRKIWVEEAKHMGMGGKSNDNRFNAI